MAKVVNVACGRLHTVALVEVRIDETVSTKVYTWGCASYLVHIHAHDNQSQQMLKFSLSFRALEQSRI